MLEAKDRPPEKPLPLRIAFFSDALPERNGAGAYYHDLLPQLSKHVEAVEVFQPVDMERPPFLSWPMPGDPSQRLVTPNLPRIAKAYKELNPNIVVSITPGAFGLLGLSYAQIGNLPFISAFHTDFEQLARIYWNPAYRKLVNAFLNTLNRILCTQSASVLVNNSGLIDDVMKLGASRTETMGTPLQPMFVETPLAQYPDKVTRICFAGRLAPEKNIDRIIEAARALPHIEFLIGGHGPLRDQLEASATELPNVTFKGWLTREDLIKLIDQCSLLILPSKIETFGSVALEAMARGRPALVSSNAGIHDWPQLKCGLFEYDQSTPLVDSIRTILELPSKELHAKSAAARGSALELNNQTILQWVDVLKRYTVAPTNRVI